jgi:predicted ATPase
VYKAEDFAEGGLPSEAVRAQLARILRSRIFSNAPTLSRLLRHLVEGTLGGHAGGQMKEYSLGVEVFDRGESFDPRTDTIVRVQARRLRMKLQVYYRTVGQFDPVLIEVPTGRYAAVFGALPTGQPHSCEDLPVTPRGGLLLRAVPKSTNSARQTLPAPRTPLIGRQRDVDEIARLLQDEGVRLVTLTGAGGSGKTRLALHTAERVARAFTGGVLMLCVAPLADATGVATALARLVGLRYTAGQLLRDALRAYARYAVTAPTLLLLDNFEHVIDASPLIVDLLEASPNLKILVTSRAVLHVYGEHEQPVPPLQVPECAQGLQGLEQNPAIQLFVQRARSVDPAFVLTGGNATIIAAICRRLDGLPLAIELAAARIKLFPPDAILGRLEHSLEFLTGGPNDAPARHRTLRSTIDWSHGLLSEPEQRLFRRLAVLVAGFTLEGAEAVCNPDRDLGIDLVGGIASLMDKSLIHQVEPIGSEARFNMLETLREYALERLTVSCDEPRTRRAHAAYAIVLAEEGGGRQSVAEREAWLQRCEIELDNFRSSLDWLVARGDTGLALRLGLALFAFWERSELLEESRRWLRAIVNLRTDAAPAPDWARAAAYLAAACDTQGDGVSARALHQQALEEFIACGDKRGEASQLNALAAHSRFYGDCAGARMYWERALTICRKLGNPAEIAAALSNLGLCIGANGVDAEARALLNEAHAIFERIGDDVGMLWSVNHFGDVARHGGDAVEARRQYQAALEGFTRLGDPWGMGRSAADLADVTGELGEHIAARAMFVHALNVFAAIDHKRGIARVLEGIAVLAERQQQFERALTLAGAAAAVRLAFGAAPRVAEQAKLQQSLAPAWRSDGDAESQAAWEHGLHMSLDEALRLASS